MRPARRRPGGSSRSTPRSPMCSRCRPTSRAGWPRRSTWRWARASATQLAERPTANLRPTTPSSRARQISDRLVDADPGRACGGRSRTTSRRWLSTPPSPWPGPSSPGRTRCSIVHGKADAPRAERPARRPSGRWPWRPNAPKVISRWAITTLSIPRDYAEALEAVCAGLGALPRQARICSPPRLSPSRVSGRWDAALEHLDEARRLDPRSVSHGTTARPAPCSGSGATPRRSRPTIGHSLWPRQTSPLRTRRWSSWPQGDLAGARAVLRARAAGGGAHRPRRVHGDLLGPRAGCWMRSSRSCSCGSRPAPSTTTVAAGAWRWHRAYALRGDRRRARAYADSARARLRGAARATPRKRSSTAYRPRAGVSGPQAEAMREGERAWRSCRSPRTPTAGPTTSTCWPGSTFSLVSPRRRSTARAAAQDSVLPLARLAQIDPTFAPLRGNPRFERLVNGS